MKHLADQAGKWVVRQATGTPRRARAARYVISLGLVGALFAVIPRTPLDGPVGGVLALAAVVVTCWLSGVGPALLMPFTVWFVSRLPFDDLSRPLIPSTQELLTFIGLTMLTGAMGLAGQSRRRLQSATRKHNARVRAQARALDAARIVFRDVEGRITTWTEGAEELYGWSSGEASGRLIYELLQTEFPIRLNAIREELFQVGQWRGEVTQITKQGRRLNIILHCILYSGDENSRMGVAEVHTDVTALRLAEAAIRESDRQKDVFVATLAHELRNPMAPLRSGLEVLQMTRATSSEDARVLGIMHRQLEHMVRMIDDLLDVSRINTGKVELRCAPVSVVDIIHDAVASCSEQIKEAGHNLTVTVPEEDVILQADAARLVQVLTNLLSNAAKFTDEGGNIQLAAMRDGDQVTIRIRDSGMGISAESLPHIFEMFAQVENPHCQSRSGLGLGLAIVRTLVEMHGGAVEAASAGLGQGSEFVIRLPAITTHVSAVPRFQQQHSSQNGEASSKRVLVVDDNRDAARMLTLMLNRKGFECHSAYDGHSALVAVEEFRPHSVVLDLGMPGMDGLEVARRLRTTESQNGPLLIALTGWDKADDRRRSQEAGFDHHLAKPVSIDRLCEMLNATRTRSPGNSEVGAELVVPMPVITTQPRDKESKSASGHIGRNAIGVSAQADRVG